MTNPPPTLISQNAYYAHMAAVEAVLELKQMGSLATAAKKAKKLNAREQFYETLKKKKSVDTDADLDEQVLIELPAAQEERQGRQQFEEVAATVERELGRTPGPWFCGSGFSTADLVFVPYVERMSASLFYYKVRPRPISRRPQARPHPDLA